MTVKTPTGRHLAGGVRRGSSRRGVLVMAALVAAAVLLGGCGLIGSVVNTTTELQKAGFSSVRVSLNPVSSGRNAVEVGVSVAAAPADAAAVTVARVVWNNLHEHFDDLDVAVNGHGPSLHRRFTFAALVGLFGPRNPAWDRTTIRSSVQNLGYALIIGLVVVAVVVAVVIMIVVHHRRRRRPPSGWPGFAGAGASGAAGAPPPPWAGPQSPGSGPPPWAGPPSPGSPPGPPPSGPGWAGPPVPPPAARPGTSEDDGHGPWGAPAPPA